MDEQKIKTELIDSLFAAYGKEGEIKRKAIYVAMLKDFPAEAIRLACRKAYLEEKYLPSISTLAANIKSLMGTANEDVRVKGWDEAWAEILKVMYATPWGKKPKFSTKEIESAVNSFGWNALQTVEQEKLTTASAQIRRYYEDVCKRTSEQSTNKYILQAAANVGTLAGGHKEGQELLLEAGDTKYSRRIIKTL